jgi:hypothetical protein
MGCMTLNQYGQCYISKWFGVGPWTFLYFTENFMSLPSNHCMLSFIHLTLQQSIILPFLRPQNFSIQAFACLILQLHLWQHDKSYQSAIIPKQAQL